MQKAMIGAFVFLLAVVPVHSVTADTISVTSGLATIGPGPGGFGTISLIGERGFSLSGSISSTAQVDAKSCFPCVVGDGIATGALFSGLDLTVSSLTFEEVTYTDVNKVNSLSGVLVGFSGPNVNAPPFTGSTAVLTFPVTLGGLLVLAPSPQATPTQHVLAGIGLGTLTLDRLPGADLWEYGGITYHVSGEAAPVPEPSTLLLFGTGIAGVVLRRKGRGGRRGSKG